MNKTHRVIWNQARNCFVVASEKTKAKGKPSTTRKTPSTPLRAGIAAAVAALFLAPGIASAGTTPVDSILTVQQSYTDQNVTINSTGSITTTTDTSAVYILLAAPHTSTFTNNGTISATYSGASGATRYGINFGDSIGAAGKLINTGSITIDTHSTSATTATAKAYGIYIGGTMAGTLTNSGRISASATAESSTTTASYVAAAAYGIHVNGNLSGTLTNSGMISTTATITSNATSASTLAAAAYGIHVNGNLSGTLTNTGTISATASVNTSYASASAYGIYVGGNLSGTLTNTGTINATANAVSSANMGRAYGVYVGGDLSVALNNSGTINATASGTSLAPSVRAYGIYVGNDLSGTLTNSGTISAIANNSYSHAKAYGIYAGSFSGVLSNTGTISANVIAQGGATAYGIYVSVDMSGTLNNSGTISASAIAQASATVHAVYVSGNLSGTLNNSGTISAMANGVLGSAHGVSVGGNLDGTLTNSGTIRATGLGDVSDTDVYSIYAPTGTGTINNQTGGLLDGRLTAGGTINVINDGTINTRLQQSSVGGDYTQNATGILEIAVDSGHVNYGKLSVGGTVTLATDTGIRVNADPAHGLAAGDTLNNVIFSGTTLSMSTLKVQDNILALNFVASDDTSNGVDLTVVSNSMSTVAAAVDGGSAGAAAVLDGMMNNPDAQPKELRDFLYDLGASGTASEVANKVSQALPIVSLSQVTATNLHSVNRVVQARMDQNRGLSSGDNFEGNRKAWIKPLGSWADQKNRDGVFGYYAKTYGVALGADSNLSQISRLGAAFAYSHSMVGGNSGLQTAGINSYQLVLYGSRSLNQSTEFNWQADYGYNQNKGNRRIQVPSVTAVSDYISNSYHIGAGIGRTMTMSEKTRFAPSFRADYTRIHSNSYSETGAGALNLNVDSQTTNEFVLAVDGKIAHTLSDTSTLVANLGLGYDTQAKRSSVTSAFQGGGAAFSTTGIDPSSTLVRGGLGMVINSSKAMEITASYDIETRSGFTGQTASVKLRMPF